jgi:hypothetical protein
MLLTLLLDALSAISEGEAILLLGKMCLLVLLPLGLLGYLWSRHIERQFDRKPKEVKPAKQVKGASLFLWTMVVVMLISFVALGTWIY